MKRVESYREQPGGSAHYSRGTPDGVRPGVFYAHLVDMRAAAIYRLENLAYHEGLPGHHMQIAIQQELTGLPLFRSHHGYTAFSEGWAPAREGELSALFTLRGLSLPAGFEVVAPRTLPLCYRQV